MTDTPGDRRRGIPVPGVRPVDVARPRIAHIGVGGFHRAHLAMYTHELAASGGDWGIRGLGMLAARRGDARRAQRPRTACTP